MTEFYYILRILLAGICGIVVGFERRNRSKEAGIRTHFIVACGAAMIMIVSKYAFSDIGLITSKMSGAADVRLDPSRIASTIASGIGFLGAGMIFVHRNTITGLTTAAGIWATSAIGMAIGAGMYVVGIAAAFIIVIAQMLSHLEFLGNKAEILKTLTIKEVTAKNYQQYITAALSEKGIKIKSVSVEKTDEEKRNYIFTIDVPDDITEDEIITLTENKSAIKNSI